MSNTPKIAVFIGPTLDISEAKKILPDAYYFPPARCGDILRASRLNIHSMALIDGHFEQTAAPWHKEFLYVIAQGITCYGASSMGALRAAELHPQGMIGIGKIFHAFKNKLINDDDEVTIIHSANTQSSRALSDAMVNIRFTLMHAVEKNIISDLTANQLTAIAKNIFYPKRRLEYIFELASQQDINIEALQNWINAGHYIDQKKADAITLLQHLTYHSIAPEKAEASTFNQSIYFKTLHKNIMSRPFPYFQLQLPATEKVSSVARLLGSTYRSLRRLSQTLAAVYQTTLTHPVDDRLTPNNPPDHEHLFLLPSTAYQEQWCRENHCSSYYYQQLSSRLEKIEKLFVKCQHSVENLEQFTDHIMLTQLRINGEYLRYKKTGTSLASILPSYQADHPKDAIILKLFAQLWIILEFQLQHTSYTPNDKSLQHFADKFRQSRQLLSKSATLQWLTEHDLDQSAYADLITFFAKFNHLVLQNGIDVVCSSNQPLTSINWFSDSLRITQVYADASQILSNSATRKAIITENQQKFNQNPTAYLLAHDFTHEYEFIELCQTLLTFDKN